MKQTNKQTTTNKFAAPRYAAADGLADGSRRASPTNGIERSLSRAVVPKTKPLPVSATTFPTALSLYIAQGRLRKDIRPLSKLFSKAEPLPFEKAMNNNLVYSSCLKHAKEMLLGDPRQADHRPANAKRPLPHRHSSITRPAARALKRHGQAPCLYMHSSTRQAQNASTCWVWGGEKKFNQQPQKRAVGAIFFHRPLVGSTRRRGDHKHDHSRFQRDID